MTNLISRLWTPSTTALAHADEAAVAARDGGWVELWTPDGQRRFGRGHLMLWPEESGASTDAAADESPEAKPVPEEGHTAEPGQTLRAELRGFTFDGSPPPVGADLLVRPDKEQDAYAVRVTDVEVAEPNGVVCLDWPDDRLPASLSELGGY